MRAAILYLTYNRKLYSEKSIQSILDHTDRSKFDLLLWDNGSNDPKDMKDWLKSLCIENKFDYVFCNQNLGLTTAMNNQMRIMNSRNNYDVFCHIANDVVVPEGWLEAVFKAVSSPKVGLVGLNLELEEDRFPVENVDGVELEKLFNECNVGGMHFCIPKRIYDTIGGFQHVEHGYGQQDANMSLIVKKIPDLGWIYYLPKKEFRGEHLGLLNFQSVDESNSSKEIYQEYHSGMKRRLKISGGDKTGGRGYRGWIDNIRKQFDKNQITRDQLIEILRVPESKFVKVFKNQILETNLEDKYFESEKV